MYDFDQMKPVPLEIRHIKIGEYIFFFGLEIYCKANDKLDNICLEKNAATRCMLGVYVYVVLIQLK